GPPRRSTTESRTACCRERGRWPGSPRGRSNRTCDAGGPEGRAARCSLELRDGALDRLRQRRMNVDRVADGGRSFARVHHVHEEVDERGALPCEDRRAQNPASTRVRDDLDEALRLANLARLAVLSELEAPHTNTPALSFRGGFRQPD